MYINKLSQPKPLSIGWTTEKIYLDISYLPRTNNVIYRLDTLPPPRLILKHISNQNRIISLLPHGDNLNIENM